MRLKKGFTLAEILIVLMVIGAIATMTIPSLMKGVTESQWKTAYKKAYNTIVNMSSMERVAGNLPATSSDGAMVTMFKTMNSSLAVKAYAASTAAQNGTILTASEYFNCVKLLGVTQGATTCTGTPPAVDNSTTGLSPWIITEDNMAYNVQKGTGTSCDSKLEINSQTVMTNVQSKSCTIITVDVNGLTNGPNIYEPQSMSGVSGAVKPLSGDRYYIYVGTDGATSGPKTLTLEGHITDDIK